MALIEVHVPTVESFITNVHHFGPIRSGTFLVLMLQYRRDFEIGTIRGGDSGWRWEYTMVGAGPRRSLIGRGPLTFSG